MKSRLYNFLHKKSTGVGMVVIATLLVLGILFLIYRQILPSLSTSNLSSNEFKGIPKDPTFSFFGKNKNSIFSNLTLNSRIKDIEQGDEAVQTSPAITNGKQAPSSRFSQSGTTATTQTAGSLSAPQAPSSSAGTQAAVAVGVAAAALALKAASQRAGHNISKLLRRVLTGVAAVSVATAVITVIAAVPHTPKSPHGDKDNKDTTSKHSPTPTPTDSDSQISTLSWIPPIGSVLGARQVVVEANDNHGHITRKTLTINVLPAITAESISSTSEDDYRNHPNEDSVIIDEGNLNKGTKKTLTIDATPTPSPTSTFNCKNGKSNENGSACAPE